MGMYVSQLRSVPIGIYNYYVYLVDVSARSEHSTHIAKCLQDMAVQSGTDAVIVRGPSDLSMELFYFMQNHASNDFGRLEHLFHEVSCLIVAKGALQTTTEKVFVIPLASPSQSSESQVPLIENLVAGLLSAMRSHSVANFCEGLGSEKMDLNQLKGGLVVATLRWLNEALELKPNIAGLGINLNAILQKILGPAQRQLPESQA